MSRIPADVAANASRQLDRFAEVLIEGGTSGPSLTQRIEDAIDTVIADLRQADAPADLIADAILTRDRAMFLVELVYAQLRDLEASIEDAAGS